MAGRLNIAVSSCVLLCPEHAFPKPDVQISGGATRYSGIPTVHFSLNNASVLLFGCPCQARYSANAHQWPALCQSFDIKIDVLNQLNDARYHRNPAPRLGILRKPAGNAAQTFQSHLTSVSTHLLSLELYLLKCVKSRHLSPLQSRSVPPQRSSVPTACPVATRNHHSMSTPLA